MTSDSLLPTPAQHRITNGPGTAAAIEAVQALTRSGLTISEIVRLCNLKPGNHSTLTKVRDGVIRGVRPAMARDIVDGHARYEAGDRSYVRQAKSKAPKNRVDIHLGPKRKPAQKPRQQAKAEEPVPRPMFDHIPGVRDRLRAARREGRRAT